VEGFAPEVTAVVEAALLTVCARGAEVLTSLAASPPYAAVNECAPTLSEEVENVAVPLLIVAVPSVVLPSRKVTVPVAVAGVTVAVSVTDCPKVEGFAEEASAVVVTALTVCVSAPEVLGANAASPE
jgi:hypothetical protein